MSHLEKLLVKELKVWYDLTTLENYVDKNMIPRGRRIRKIPSTVNDDDFTAKWNSILTNCSIKLIQLIISQEATVFNDVRSEIKDIQKNIIPFAEMELFIDMDNKLKTNIR